MVAGTRDGGQPLPVLTSVAINFEDAGFLAAKALDEYFDHSPPPFSAPYASPAVVARESTDERLSSDALVRRALELINAANGAHMSEASLVHDLRVSKSSLKANLTTFRC